MTTPDYSTTRKLTSEKPACFDTAVDGMQTLLKTPDSEQKIAEGGLRLQGLYKTNSEDKPLITVVTVVYNGAEFLEETIKSVIEQTYDNVEYIIVDGGSTDGTLEIIKKYGHAIDYWVSEPDKGIYDAMNKGIDCSSGSWISILNSDDFFFTKDTLKFVSANLINKNLDVYCGSMYLIDRYTGALLEKRSVKVWKLFFGMYVNHPSTLVSRATYASLLKYDSSFKMAADYKFMLTAILKRKKFMSTSVVLTKMRCGGESIKNLELTKYEEEKARQMVLPYFIWRLVSAIKKIRKGIK